MEESVKEEEASKAAIPMQIDGSERSNGAAQHERQNYEWDRKPIKNKFQVEMKVLLGNRGPVPEFNWHMPRSRD
ncbi:hypothetical protein GCM10023155_03580 [Bremerella cremea]